MFAIAAAVGKDLMGNRILEAVADRTAARAACARDGRHGVNNATSAPWPPGATGQRWLFHALLALGALATVAATIIGNGNIAVAAAPALGLADSGVLLIAPLRLPLFALILLCLGLDATTDGPWDSPLAPIGRLLVHNLAKTIQGANLPFQLFAAVFVFLLVIHAYRRLSGSRIDSLAYRGVAKPLSLAMACSLVAAFAEFANGSLRGGDMQMAKIQIQSFVLTLLLAYLLSVALRGIQDYKIIGRLVLAAACSKAIIAIYVYKRFCPTIVPKSEVATTHGDSMLFTTATIMLISRFYEQPIRRNACHVRRLLPLLFCAMVANNRRLAWVEIAASIIALVHHRPPVQLKRVITQSLLLSVPARARVHRGRMEFAGEDIRPDPRRSVRSETARSIPRRSIAIWRTST